MVNLVYYGTILGIHEIHVTSSIHLNPVIVAMVEIPAYIVCALIMSMTGRKPIL